MEPAFQRIKKFVLNSIDTQIEDYQFRKEPKDIDSLKSLRKKVESVTNLSHLQDLLKKEHNELYLAVMETMEDE